jgi:ribosomal protein S5
MQTLGLALSNLCDLILHFAGVTKAIAASTATNASRNDTNVEAATCQTM